MCNIDKYDDDNDDCHAIVTVMNMLNDDDDYDDNSGVTMISVTLMNIMMIKGYRMVT